MTETQVWHDTQNVPESVRKLAWWQEARVRIAALEADRERYKAALEEIAEQIGNLGVVGTWFKDRARAAIEAKP